MKTIFPVIIAMLLISCSSTRQTSKVGMQENVGINQSTHVEMKDTTTTIATITIDMSEGENMVTEVIEYDTSLPADPNTGTPPIKKITTQTKQKNTKVLQSEKSELHNVKEVLKDSSRIVKSDIVVNTENTAKNGLNWMQNTLCVLGVILVLVLVLWVVFKLK